MAYAKIENGAVQIYHSLPQNYTFADGGNTGNFADMSANIHKAEGFLPFDDSPPSYDHQASTLEQDGYEVTESVIRRQYKITPIPQEIIDARETEVTVSAWQSIRATRDQLLKQSDWTQLADVASSPAWVIYRQTLRDITDIFSSPELVIWPDKPL